jgi:hypothetical protein
MSTSVPPILTSVGLCGHAHAWYSWVVTIVEHVIKKTTYSKCHTYQFTGSGEVFDFCSGVSIGLNTYVSWLYLCCFGCSRVQELALRRKGSVHSAISSGPLGTRLTNIQSLSSRRRRLIRRVNTLRPSSTLTPLVDTIWRHWLQIYRKLYWRRFFLPYNVTL